MNPSFPPHAEDQKLASRLADWVETVCLNRDADEMVASYAGTPCVSPFSTVIIEVDGKVPLCGVGYNVKHPMSDFSRQSIKEIWNSEPFAQVRWQHANTRRNDIAMCQGCRIDEELMVTESIGRIPGQPISVAAD